MTGLLRDSLQPTDFADADHRVGTWYFADFYPPVTGCRVHMVRTGGYWFQRHEWSRSDRNSTMLDDWLYLGFRPSKSWPDPITDHTQETNRHGTAAERTRQNRKIAVDSLGQ